MGCGASTPKEPKGFLFRVRLLGGLNLYNNGFGVQVPGTYTNAGRFEGKSDPYVVLTCTGTNQTHTSEVILHDQNPVWNQEFYFSCNTKAPVLTLTVKDKEFIGNDDVMGVAQINLNGLITKDKEREMWLPLQGSKSRGEVGIAVVEAFRMHVTAKQGVDVQPMDALTGSSDVYMSMTIGQQASQKTSTRKWTLNPIWNEVFTFFLPYSVKSQLSMILYDHDNVGVDNNMGWHYAYFEGKPVTPGQPREFQCPITNAKGRLDFTLVDDITLDNVTEAPPVTEQMKKAWPLDHPSSCTFEVTVLGAFNLAAADINVVNDIATIAGSEIYHEFKEYSGTSDPFARVTCEGVTYDTRHVNSSLEPVWNEKFRFICNNREQSELKVEVLDHDLLVNDSIGAVKIPIRNLKPGKRQEIWSFLDRGRGEIGVEIVQHHQLRVKIVAASGLPAKDMNGMCDPYVKLELGGLHYQTRVVRNDRSPWFDEDFRFCLPTLNNLKLKLTIWDSDLMIFKKGASEDYMGECEVDVAALVPGLPNEFKLKVKVAGSQKEEGELNVIITEEVPLPESVLGLLAEKGKEAFDSVVKGLGEVKEMVTTLKLPDFENKKEGEYQVTDPKLAPRPRFGKIDVETVAVRGLKGCSEPFSIGVSVPQQGKRQKTKEYRNPRGCDLEDRFEFPLPSRTTGCLEVTVFESTKHPYTSWTNECFARGLVHFKDFNGGDGLVRGAQPDDTWIQLPDGKGNVIVRVREMLRYQIRIVGAKGIKVDKDPLVQLKIGNDFWKTSYVSHNPEKDRTTGIAGEPRWNEQFTIFRKEKDVAEFRLMDVSMTGNTFLGKAEFDLSQLRRGVLHKAELPISNGGTLFVEILEEEKMALLDRMIDAAANAAKLAEALAAEVKAAAAGAVDAAADAVSGGVKALGSALGGLF